MPYIILYIHVRVIYQWLGRFIIICFSFGPVCLPDVPISQEPNTVNRTPVCVLYCPALWVRYLPTLGIGAQIVPRGDRPELPLT